LSCTFQVLITDNIDPVLVNCPGNQAVYFTDDCDYALLNYISTFGVFATDNCDNNVTVAQTPVVGTLIYGNTVVIITATDDSGNALSCSFDVTPSDVTPPVISGCPSNFDVSYNTSCGFVIPDYIVVLGMSVTDNCYATTTVYVNGDFNLIGNVSGTGSFGCASGKKISATAFNFGSGLTHFDAKCFAHH
jgi:hypothetical protein